MKTEATFEEIRDRVALELKPMFEAGKIRGWLDADFEKTNGGPKEDPGYWPPFWKLEAECAKRLRTLRAAFTVLMASPYAGNGWEEYEMNYRLRERTRQIERTAKDRANIMRSEACGKAGVALSMDILLIARARRWYLPAKGEQPTTAELRRAA